MLNSDVANPVLPQESVQDPGLTGGSWLDRPLLAVLNLDLEKALYGLLILLALFTRLWDLQVRVMSHDETVHVQWSWYLYRGSGYEHTPLSHGPFLFHATALSYYLFGDNDFSARLVVALMGVVLVVLPYALRRWLGRSGALVTSFLFLISPSLLYYSRYIRHDIPIILWALLALWAIFRYLEERQERWLMVLAAALSLMLATKEVSFIYIAIFGLFLVLLFFVRMGVPRWQAPDWEQSATVLLWIAAVALFITMATFVASKIAEKPPVEETGDAAMVLEQEGLGQEELDQGEPDQEPEQEGRDLADWLSLIAFWAAGATVATLAGYVGMLALGSPTHQRLVWTVLGLLGVLAVAMVLLLFSLGLVELFPIRYRDCGQVPVPGPRPGEMTCPDAGCEIIQERCQRVMPVVAADDAIERDETGTRIAIRLSRVEMMVAVVLVSIVALMAGIGAYIVLERLMPFRQGEKPALDLILFVGSFTLPFLAALAIHGVSGIVSRLLFGYHASFNALDYSDAGLVRSLGFVLVFLAVSVAVGVWWDRRRWIPAALIFYVIFVVLFTTVFTNGTGLASGMVGSLGYWLEQQEVQRGSQPPYYYALLVPLYEYLSLFGFSAAFFYVVANGLRDRRRMAFVLFLLLWTPLTWLAYSVAGEKMPWLTVHFAVPMALATGWLAGQLIDATDPETFPEAGTPGAYWRAILRRGGWALLLAAPVGLAALNQVVGPWLGGTDAPRPFSGYTLGQLDVTMQFVAALAVFGVVALIFYRIWLRIGGRAVGRLLAALSLGLLAALTIRTAWMFAYINYDYATEFMVYAHSTPDVREVMEQVEDISRRTAGDLSLDIGYTSDGSYPFIWYLRNYSNATTLPKPPSRADVDKSVIIAGDAEWSGIEPYIGDRYVCNQYNFLWWPMQDYYDLDWERVRYAIFNPAMRAAMWDIIFKRDYRAYEQATGKTVRPSEWPLRDGFRFCIRRDVMAQVWSVTRGPVAYAPEASETVTGSLDYADLEQPAAAELVIGELGPLGNLNSPHGLTLDAEGFVYVADSNNHRIVKFAPDGTVADTWDSTWWHGLQSWQPGCLNAEGQPLALGDGEFCEPWGITVGPEGRIYVADTWNHRVQVFDAQGQFLGKFGTFGQSGGSVSGAPGQFYGPRDVVVDDQGRVYVSDTGNKRVQVFDADWTYHTSFGGPGLVEGRMDEPVGLAIGPDDLLYVADTWNLRVQAFTLEGDYERQWPVDGWESQSIVNKPYLATDSAGHVYVSDPENRRVIAFDPTGLPLAVLGNPGDGFLQLPTGIALDAQDRLWVSDAQTQRLLRFPPLAFGTQE